MATNGGDLQSDTDLILGMYVVTPSDELAGSNGKRPLKLHARTSQKDFVQTGDAKPWILLG